MGHLIIQRQTGFLSSASVHSQWKINSLKQNKTESMKTNLLRHKVRKMTLAITKKLVILQPRKQMSVLCPGQLHACMW